MSQNKAQTFNDGIVKIYRLENVAEKGEAPEEKPVLKCSLRYKERTVGFGRYYTAMQAKTKVSALIRCPRVPNVKEKDVAVLMNDKKYEISLIQYPEDIVPPVMDLTLERVK